MSNEVGVKYPFTINGGRVVTTDNQSDIITSRVTFCLATQVGERVMLPAWGINIMQSMFELEGASTQAIISDAIRAAFREWFPNNVQVKKIEFPPGESDRGVLQVRVTWGNYDGTQDTTIQTGVPTGGAEIYGNEGPR